jgi:predicted dehydrogenase
MSTKTTLNIGLVGCGFHGPHALERLRQGQSVFRVGCPAGSQSGLRPQSGDRRGVRAKLGLRSFETDWRALVRRPDIDLIDIASPNDTHMEIAIAAAERARLFSA